jgi:hypothetical protein
MASDSVGMSGCFSAHRTISARITGSARKPIIGVMPVAVEAPEGHEAPAPIGQKAQLAADRRARKAAEEMTTGRRFTPAGFSATFTACLRGRMTNLRYFLPGPLTEHGDAITGRVGLVQFPKASLDPRLQNI